MAGFATRDDLIAEAVTNGKIETFNFVRSTGATEAAGYWVSLWGSNNPATTPGTAFTSDETSQAPGAMWFPNRSPDLRFLTSLAVSPFVTPQGPMTILLYDRLAGVSGVSWVNGNQTINSVGLPRYSGTAALNNEAWLEVTSTTSGAGTATLAPYVAADASSGNGEPVSFATALNAGTIIRLPLASNRPGVRSVTTVTFAVGAAGGTANLVIVHPLAAIACDYGGGLPNPNTVSFLDDIMSLPRIYDGATLFLAIVAPGTNAMGFLGSIQAVFG